MKTVIEMATAVGYPLMVFDGKPYVCPELERLVAAVRADERSSWPAEMEAMERQVNILTDALAESRREIDALVALARADEREACAKVCDRMAQRTQDIRSAALESAAENIRTRSNT